MTEKSRPIRTFEEGLSLRWGQPEDAEALAEFNVTIHSDNPAQPETSLGHWTHDLMNGKHPTTGPQDFTVVTDSESRIVSTSVLISQTWALGGTHFGVGQVELVGTLSGYRRRGLVRAQMEELHALSARREHQVQIIMGIPWFYRQFGYEMALGLHGGRAFSFDLRGNDKEVSEETYDWRPAMIADIPLLNALYAIHCRAGLVCRIRDEAEWRYDIAGRHRESIQRKRFRIVRTKAGTDIGYVEYTIWPGALAIREVAVLPGHSLRAVCLFLTRMFKSEMMKLSEGGKPPIKRLVFFLGTAHPAYEALGRQLEMMRRPYAWYVRVANLPAFLQHIAPVLEERLSTSVMAGHSGTLALDFYGRAIKLQFQDGRLIAVEKAPGAWQDGDACFPDHTFLQLLMGRCTLAELNAVYPDVFAANAEAEVLLGILFPAHPSIQWPQPSPIEPARLFSFSA